MQFFLRCVRIAEIFPCHLAFFIGDCLKPCGDGLVVVRSGIGNAVFIVIMRQVVVPAAGVTTVKGKFQHLHIWETAVSHKLTHAVRHKSEIFCNDLTLSECRFNCMEQFHARTLFPVSILCCFVTVGNRIIFVKAAEMVNSDHIIHRKALTQAFNPPFEAGSLVIFPVIQRIAPELSVCCKTIRRTACHSFRQSHFI